MAIQNINISLRALKTGTALSAADFISQLNILESDKIIEMSEGGIAGQSAYVDFLNSQISDYLNYEEPDVEIQNEIQQTLNYIADWIKQRPIEIWQNFAESQLKVEIFIDVYIDQNQFEIELTPDFLLICSQNKIGLGIITND